jgi:hypothetical protein
MFGSFGGTSTIPSEPGTPYATGAVKPHTPELVGIVMSGSSLGLIPSVPATANGCERGSSAEQAADSAKTKSERDLDIVIRLGDEPRVNQQIFTS